MSPVVSAGGSGGSSTSSGAAAAAAANSGGGTPEGMRGWIRGAYRFATDRNDFRRNLVVNLGLFAVGVWVARHLTDIDLMAPQPVA